MKECLLPNTNKENKMQTRLYKITEIATGIIRIVEATNAATAMKHVAEANYTCISVGGLDAVKLIDAGVKFEPSIKGGKNEQPNEQPTAI